jgi:lysophospholipase L1-like esterase
MNLTRYIALGDSISIDDYPRRETGVDGLGAASLLQRNDDRRWPEFHGRDLATIAPSIDCRNLTADGATTADVLERQLPRVARGGDAALVTLTAGGNDLLLHLRSPRPPANLVDGLLARLRTIVSGLRERLPHALVLLGTIYDPSDGTNVLYGERLDREAEWLARANAGIRALAAESAGVVLTDLQRHFLGHGMRAPENDRWYWSGLLFEPSARGASEVRRLWLDALRANDAGLDECNR